MKRKIDFKPQEFVAVIVEVISSAYLVKFGIPMVTANIIGKSLGGVAKGLSLSKSGSAGTIISLLEKSISSVLDSNELTEELKESLRTASLSPKDIIKFMCQSDPHIALTDQITQMCEYNPNLDISTFPIDELASEIIQAFEDEVFNNHELATYATYCTLQKDTYKSGVHLANQQYINSFTDTLFLHKKIEDSRVNLKNLFVIQKYRFINNGYSEFQEKHDNKGLQDVIADFLQENITPFLFIEGDAGSGKTSLVAWMNYHYSIGDEVAVQLFGKRPLLTIRLRDLDKKDIADSGSLTSAIRKYMNLSSLDQMERLFPNAVMLLDGFDELCMIEGIGFDHENLIYDLYKKNLKGFHFIITTRPKFIRFGINLPSVYISLNHFDSDQRNIWLDKYTSAEYCAQAMDKTVYDYIKDIDDDTSSCICDTPMTLYMLAAKKGATEFLENNWALYHHIFYEELSETEYNKMFPNPDREYSHDISKLRDVLYQVSEEIAYRMYKNNNRSFYLHDNELLEIVEGLSNQIPVLKHANMKDISSHCYALCCYWKANFDRGVVEFLHNNIRDFFLAEKIYREMDAITQQIRDAEEIDYDRPFCKMITNKLCSLFQYGVLETKVTEFLLLRAKYQAENNISDFAQYEYEYRLITNIISFISDKGITWSGVLAKEDPINPVQKITNILTCTIQLYRHIYEVYLKEPELIHWQKESPFETHNMFTFLFKSIFCQVPVTISSNYMITLGSRGYFNNINFNSCDLRNIGFQGSHIENANLSDTILCGCDFSNAILDGSNFTNADIHYASLEGASLKGCDMTGADLRGTELPDGFMSTDQAEQVEHLKSMRIDRLKV